MARCGIPHARFTQPEGRRECDARTRRSRVFPGVFDRPDFSFNSIFDFATDVATSETGIGFNPVTGAVGNPLFSLMRTGSLSAFIQDDWKVKPNFTLSMGFRYEDFFNPSDATGKVCEMAFPVKGSLPTQIANGVMTCRGNMFNGTMNTWSPRIGFAWDPTKEGKMSVRGGIGIFYDRPSDQLDNNYYTNTPQFAVGGAFSNTPAQSPSVCPWHDSGSAL